MINVKISRNSAEIKGHANYDKKGKDIVCAAVSVLTHTLVISLQAFTEDKIEFIEEDGYIKLNYKNLSNKGRLLMDSFFIGICGISENYPEYVTIQ